MYLKAYIQNLVENGHVVSEKSKSSFEQNIMGPSPRFYIPRFVENGPLILEKIFEGFLPYMGMAAISVT